MNGEGCGFEPGTTLTGVIRSLDLDPQRVAVEFNRAIVKRDLWDTTEVEDGSEIEIVMFVGGG